MRALLAALVLLLAGCGDDAPSWTEQLESGPENRTLVTVTAWRGAVRLRNSTNGRIEFSVRGVEAPSPREGWIRNTAIPPATPKEPPGKRVALVVPEAAKDIAIEIEIAAPPGVSVSCACAEAAVEVAGSWARLEVKTAGAITARVEGADSGELESRSGSVLYAAARGPAGELYAKAGRGAVTVRLPAAWNGIFHGTTETGKLDVPPHKNLETIWDEDRKHVAGRVGPRGGVKVLPTVWGLGRGDVSIRLDE